jgi:Putative adhesin
MNSPLRLLISASVLFAAALPAFAKVERTVEKTFTVQPGGSLHIETQGGNVSVQPSTDGTVKIIAKEKIHADSETEADEILKDLTLTIEQEGNVVSAVAKYEKDKIGMHWGSWPPVQVDFVITAPASFTSDLRTSGGNLVVGDFAGKVHARTSGGEVKLGKLGADVDAATSGGGVSLVEGRGSVKLNTSGGNVFVGHAVGVTDLRTSGGDIKVDSVENTLQASTSGGDIRVGFVGPLKGDCSLGTSGGTVKVTVDKAAAFKLDASTSGGDVKAQGLTITLDSGGQRKSHLAGTVNGGGPLLKLRSSGGDVAVALN